MAHTLTYDGQQYKTRLRWNQTPSGFWASGEYDMYQVTGGGNRPVRVIVHSVIGEEPSQEELDMTGLAVHVIQGVIVAERHDREVAIFHS